MASKKRVEEFRRIRHDLRGPLINIEGFAKEIKTAVVEIRSLIDRHQQDSHTEIDHVIRDLLNDDVVPCLNYLQESVTQLNQRIDESLNHEEKSKAENTTHRVLK